ncbi:MAG: response regulator transcription factor, partial [Anaerolineae bacterium]
YVLKGILAENLAQAVRTIAAGEVFVSPRLAGGILYEMTRLPARDPLAELTRREFEVLTLVTEGLKNREIADRLYLSEKTVKSYMSTILQKLQVRSRTEAALLAQRRGLAAPK